MNKSATLTTCLILGFLCAACTTAPTQTATRARVAEPRIVISEVLAGVEGNNQYEFIELYNAGSAPLDLQGWSLWYRLATSEDSLIVMDWQEL